VFGGPPHRVTGSLSIEVLSPLGEASRDADARAFAALMRHIKAVDGRAHTVIMIQVENEVGMQGDTRDRSPAANKAFEGPAPKGLMDYLEQHKETLIPELRKVWEAAGFKTNGTWEEVFGKGRPADEIFMAWNFARYVNRVVEAGKAEYPIPMMTNCPQEGFGRAAAPGRGTGQSGGPMPDAMDIWRAGGPQIDLFGADIYSPDFVGFCARYAQSGNPLFIPETGVDAKIGALYAFARHDGIGFSPFGIDRTANSDPDPYSYDLLSRLAPLILEHQGKGEMSAVLMGPKDAAQKVKVGDYTVEAVPTGVRGGSPAQTPQPTAPAVAIFIQTGPDEFFTAGYGISAVFSPNTPGLPLAGMATVEEGTFVDGRWVPGRLLAGDDTGQGQRLDFRNMGIQRVTLYRYR
jgi:hypothetical protein